MKAGSITVGIAVDKVMEKAQVSQAMAKAALRAPSFAVSLLAPTGAPSEPGGLFLTFDR